MNVPCRCEALREVFGRGAPTRCGPCDNRRKVVELEKNGFLRFPYAKAATFREAGVTVHTVDFGESYAPGWAVALHDVLPACCDVLAPLLRACVQDQNLRAQLDSVQRLSRDPGYRVLEFAIVYGAVSVAEVADALAQSQQRLPSDTL